MIATALTIGAALLQARARLEGSSDSAALDSELLLMHVLDCSRSHLRAWPERALGADEASAYQALIERRADGEPVAYIIGLREFWSLQLQVTAATLIPRPDTETLVEQALLRIPRESPWRIADLGTGSGAIALAIAKERPQCRLLATDASDAALTVARHNAECNGINNVEFRPGRWYAPLRNERFELIVSNPPYVRSDDPHLNAGDVRFEPRTALVAGADGLDDIRLLVAGALHHLRPQGWLLLEHGYDQGEAVRTLLAVHGFEQVCTQRDHGGQERVSGGRLPASSAAGEPHANLN